MGYVYLLLAVVVTAANCSTMTDKWKTLSACTTEDISSVEIDCFGERIQVGRSHYGVKDNAQSGSGAKRCEPDFTDCVMDYTSKSAEQCNGLNRCTVSLLTQFIHKCRAPASYFHLHYRCVHIPSQSDICRSVEYRTKEAHTISPLFPYNYPKNVDCTCLLNRPEKTVLLAEGINFQVQPPDAVHLYAQGSPPVLLLSNNASMMISDPSPVVVRFQSDSSLSRPGFWLTFSAYRTCSSEWEPLDDKCVRVFRHKLPWQYASQKCQSIGGHLLTIRDSARETRVQRLVKRSGLSDQESIWIGLKTVSDSLVWADGTDEPWTGRAIWPWDKSLPPPAKFSCVARYGHHWQIEDCAAPKFFICEQDLSRVKQEMAVSCGPTAVTTSFRPLPEPEGLLPLALPDVRGNLFATITAAADGRNFKRNASSYGLGLVLVLMILVLITLVICNVILIYLCQKRLRKTLQTYPDDEESARQGNSRKGLTCWRRPRLFSKKENKRKQTRRDEDYYPICCHPCTCQRFSFLQPSNATMLATNPHFYEPVVNPLTDSGYSTVPRRCPYCRPLTTSLLQRRCYKLEDNRKRSTVDELLFSKTLSNDSTVG